MKTASHVDLHADKVLKVFQDISRHFTPSKIMVGVTGGEPLSRPDLLTILDGVSRLGFPWGMVTNGWLVTPEIARRCALAGMKTVSVSIDGLETQHDWLRNRAGAFARAFEALRIFLEIKAFSQVEAITCVHRGNLADLPALGEHLRRLGVTGWRLLTIFPKGQANLNPDLIVTGEVLRGLFAFIQETRSRFPDWKVNYSEEGFLGHHFEGRVRSQLHFCGAGINVGSLLADGSFGACPSLGPEWVQGHVDELPFPKVWETRYRRFRRPDMRKNDFCGNCHAWKNCHGSSLHLWDTRNNRPRVCHLRMLEA